MRRGGVLAVALPFALLAAGQARAQATDPGLSLKVTLTAATLQRQCVTSLLGEDHGLGSNSTTRDPGPVAAETAEALPADLDAAVGPSSAGVRRFVSDSAHGRVWAVPDMAAKRCTVAAHVADARLLKPMTGSLVLDRPAGKGSDPNGTYTLSYRREDADNRMRVTIAIPDAEGVPFTIATERLD